MKMPEEKIEGLGGWLLVFQISFISGILFLAYYSFLFALSLFYEWDYLVCVFFILYFLTLLAYGFSLLLFYNKKKLFPIFTIILLWSSFIIPLGLSFIFHFPKETLFNIILKGWNVPTIWTLYLLKSQRVKNTFVK